MKWEYCECGCKGFVGTFAGEYYWIYLSLKPIKNPAFLHQGHGSYSYKLGAFGSMKEAEKFLVDHNKDNLKDLQRKLKILQRDVKLIERHVERENTKHVRQKS